MDQGMQVVAAFLIVYGSSFYTSIFGFIRGN